MSLIDFGFDKRLEKIRTEYGLSEYEAGRVVSENRGRYIVRTENGEMAAEVSGAFRYAAGDEGDFPVTGDWVALTFPDDAFALIHRVYPRERILRRQSVDARGGVQIIASNVDCALLVQALDDDFSLNRLERYLTLCNASGIEAVTLLTKSDLVDEATLASKIDSIRKRLPGMMVLAVSSVTNQGYDRLSALFTKGRTYCLLGSSGVGKSTLLNHLLGREALKTAAISTATGKGCHTTTHREMLVLENGAILIDNPGMREVGIVDEGGGLLTTFDSIATLARQCRFKDCTHTGEEGCAVLKALDENRLDRASYDNFLRMQREKSFFDSSLVERRQKDRAFGKMLQNFHKRHSGNKFE